MSFTSLKRYLPSAPPRQVVLLSDALFFMRSVPVTEGASAAEVAAQAELAVEALAPFPIAQLYYGHYWLPGAAHALIYAAYRKRFTADEVGMWADAEAVLPAFVTVLNKAAVPSPATVLIAPGAAGFTGLYFSDGSGVPTQVRVEPFVGEATEEERAAARERLLAAFPEKYHVIEAGAEPQLDPDSPQGGFVFHAGDIEARFEREDIAPLDVRDKAELVARRRAHARDVILWRVFLGCVAAIVLSALLEVALLGTSIWQKQRLALEAQQRPLVKAIETSQSLATRIDELSTKRLLPFEMLALVNTVRPSTIQFTRTTTNGLYTLEANAQTSSTGDIDVFRSALQRLEACEKAEVPDVQSSNGISTFRLSVTFKPDAFAGNGRPPQPEPAIPAPASIPTEPSAKSSQPLEQP
jgi:hypothetical protein